MIEWKISKQDLIAKQQGVYSFRKLVNVNLKIIFSNTQRNRGGNEIFRKFRFARLQNLFLCPLNWGRPKL
jgi:hypothetical protein